MIISLSPARLVEYVQAQLKAVFPDNGNVNAVSEALDDTLDRVRHCFTAIANRYFRKNSHVYLDHLHSDQYSMFLYLLSNTLFRRGAPTDVCSKVYYLNKALHSIDVYYEVALPSIFLFGHAVGSVLGRAEYSDYLLVQQNCTVGAAREAQPGEPNQYPTIGRLVSIYKGAAVLGRATIGDNVKVSAHSIVFDEDVPADSIYIGTRGSSIIKPNKHPDNVWALS